MAGVTSALGKDNRDCGGGMELAVQVSCQGRSVHRANTGSGRPLGNEAVSHADFCKKKKKSKLERPARRNSPREEPKWSI